MAVQNYATMHDLRAQTLIADGNIAVVAGYYALGDGGGGTHRYSSSSTTPVNDGSVVCPDTGYSEAAGYAATGRWILAHEGFVNIRQFGAVGDGISRELDTDAFDRFVDTDVFRQAGRLYSGGHGTPFSGLRASDTWDWAAIQAALVWCAEEGVRLEGNQGEYMIARPLWLGDDDVEYDQPEGEDKFKDPSQQGLTFVGQTGNSRRESDGQACNIRLTADCSNRYCLSSNVGTVATDTFRLVLPEAVGGGTTADIDVTEQHAIVVAAIETALGSNPYSVVYVGDDTTDTIDEVNLYFRIVHDTIPSPAYLGPITPIQGVPSTDPTYVVRCLPDSGVVSFRRSAGLFYRLEGLTLSANSGSGARFASFGVLFATSQFVGHVVERVNVAFVDTGLGILQGTGANGEQCSFTRLACADARRAFYSDAPQAFQQDMTDWNAGLDNDGVFAEFAEVSSPGVGAWFTGCSGTFGGAANPNGAGTLVKVRRGTGVARFDSGRFEHLSTLLDYDSADDLHGANDNLDLVVRAVDFGGMRGGSDRSFLKGSAGGATKPTNYGLAVQDCRFSPFVQGTDPAKADLRLASETAEDGLRAVFERCRFVGVRSIQSAGAQAGFHGCYRNDFSGAGAVQAASGLREFTQPAALPRARTQRVQSVRTVFQDTPWAQTGPRTNLLTNSDFQGQADSTGPETGVAFNTTANNWALAGAPDLAGFGKWGKFADANISPSPEAFYLGLRPASRVASAVSAIDLNLPKPGTSTDPCSKTVAYQGLLRVKGKVRFALVSSVDQGVVYDEVVVESPLGSSGYVWSETALVSLRYSEHSSGPSSVQRHAVVRVENARTGSGENSALQVLWQQAWGGSEAQTDFPLALGLANAGQARTPINDPVANTYPWAVNALGVRAAGRLQLPLLDTGDNAAAAGMGWRSAVAPGDYDLQDGELYMDDNLNAMLGRAADDWYQFVQPERVTTNPGSITWDGTRARNIVYDDNTSPTVTLSSDVTKVPRGSIVRVFSLNTGVSTVTVKVGTSTVVAMGNKRMTEMLFYVDGSGNGKWLVLQKDLPTERY